MTLHTPSLVAVHPSCAPGHWPSPRRDIVESPRAAAHRHRNPRGASTVGADAPPLPFQDLEAADLLQLNAKLTGDFDQMQERRFVRALVPFSRTYYFIDGGSQRGLAFDVLTELERELAKRVPKGKIPPKIRDHPHEPRSAVARPRRGVRRHRGWRVHGDRGPAGPGGFLGADQDRHPRDRRHRAGHSADQAAPGPVGPAGARPSIEQLLRGPGRPQCAAGTGGPGPGAD